MYLSVNCLYNFSGNNDKINLTITNETESQISVKCDPTPGSVELNLNNYNENSSLYIDPYYWPSEVHHKFIQFCVEKGPEFFQNKNKNFNQSARCDGKL